MKIKILIVDDSAVVRAMLKHLLSQDDRFELLGTAENGKDAVEKNDELKPDFIIMDLNMPVMDGIEASRHILNVSNPAIVAFTTEDYAAVSYKSYEVGILEVIKKPDLASMKQFVLEEFIDRLFYIAQTHKLKKEKAENKQKSTETDSLTAENTGLLTEKSSVNESVVCKFEEIPVEEEKLDLKRRKPYELVAIGSSTGGPAALKIVLSSLGKSFPLPVLITQHNDSSFDQYLVDWLANTTGMDVVLAKDGDVLAGGRVYIAPSDFHLTIQKNAVENRFPVIRLNKEPPVNYLRPAVDKMFESIAKICGETTIAAILTGMGKDGASGIKMIHDAGGYTIAESGEDCTVFGMPKAAIDCGAASIISRLNDIAPLIVKKVCDRAPEQIKEQIREQCI